MNEALPNSSLAYVWLMATFSAKAAKVQRRDIIATDISSVCHSISRARAVALHTSSSLLHGTTIIYDMKASYLLTDTQVAHNLLNRQVSESSVTASHNLRGSDTTLKNDPTFAIELGLLPDLPPLFNSNNRNDNIGFGETQSPSIDQITHSTPLRSRTSFSTPLSCTPQFTPTARSGQSHNLPDYLVFDGSQEDQLLHDVPPMDDFEFREDGELVMSTGLDMGSSVIPVAPQPAELMVEYPRTHSQGDNDLAVTVKTKAETTTHFDSTIIIDDDLAPIPKKRRFNAPKRDLNQLSFANACSIILNRPFTIACQSILQQGQLGRVTVETEQLTMATTPDVMRRQGSTQTPSSVELGRHGRHSRSPSVIGDRVSIPSTPSDGGLFPEIDEMLDTDSFNLESLEWVDRYVIDELEPKILDGPQSFDTLYPYSTTTKSEAARAFYSLLIAASVNSVKVADGSPTFLVQRAY
uniref:ARAD1D42636p n=1 Tax=Blastobotrys adeninivorans TaxID=409370 RepID=A0A060TIZ6_BLAAD